MKSLNTQLTANAGLALSFGLLLASCGGGGGSGGATPPATQLTQLSCEQLAAATVASPEIGLPSGGAVVTQTMAVPASEEGAVPAHCLLSGSIKPLDAEAPDIRFQLALPVEWNRKAVMFGGGGLNGTIPPVAGAIPNTPPGAASPLQKGYAVFGSDSGHQAASPPGSADFALNDESLKNFMGDALKKTRDAAMALIAAHYGARPTTSYFIGLSSGGKEALQVAGRWGADWNGVVAFMPAVNFTGLTLSVLHSARTFARPGAWLSRQKRQALRSAALQSCDMLDGVQDGVITAVSSCNAVFDPATAQLGDQPLLCAAGTDTDNCLTDAQIDAIATVNNPLLYGFPMSGGHTRYPGWNVLTSDLGGPQDDPINNTVASFSLLGHAAPAFPVNPGMGIPLLVADEWFRYAIARDPNANFLEFDPADPGPYEQRINELAAIEAAEQDLSTFEGNGGKLLIVHGTADVSVNPRATEAYYQKLRATMGGEAVDRFVRFYLIPGFNHFFGATFTAAWDQLGAIEDWVERGVDPRNNQVVMDLVGVPGRTRPLCSYPSRPEYSGTGDVNSAASFTCQTD